MTRRQLIVVLMTAALGLGGAVVIGRQMAARSARAAATYYCPMHPTYTSNRPGDCPICNMKLVPKDAPAAEAQPAPSAKDICYMHNCPMVHDGKPCPMLVVAKEGEPVECPVCKSHVSQPGAAGRRILYWTDPMMPGYRAQGPGKSPMGMDLVPVYEEAAGAGSHVAAPEGYAPVLLTPQKQQLIGVTAAAARRQRLAKTIRTVGSIAHDPELYQAQQEFIQTHRAWQQAQQSQLEEVREQARRLMEATRLRLRHLGLSEAMIDEIAGWDQPDHRLLLGGDGQFWVYASIYEYELPLIREDQAVLVQVNSLPGTAFEGTVRAIDPMLDQTTRTARARILLNDPQGLLRPGMYVDVSIQVDLGEVLAVPREAIFETGTKQIVFVDRGQGLFEPRDVVVGARTEGLVEIKAGVVDGERIVTSGNFLIDSESRLKAALEGAAPGAEPAGAHQYGQ
jgi:hypothetical protein